MKQAALPSTIPTKTVLAAASIHFHDICLELDVVSLPCQVEAVLWVGSGEKQAAVVLLPPLPSVPRSYRSFSGTRFPHNPFQAFNGLLKVIRGVHTKISYIRLSLNKAKPQT